ncbi:MAG TPA: SDR family oxidoreductase [Candidatus Sulfopaludibacter sp.]|jgi:NAD(P)-dependent dehydrogenase (short-subunit alcohol dehydrogenase family)|nr:SDR family oxidoreductase [Candidatus Sulfopaludibacter sp.]
MMRPRHAALLVGAGVAAAFMMRRKQAMDLHGKVVLITGGSRGLGLAMARGFAEQGARLAICARSETELAAAKQDLAPVAEDVITVKCDVADYSQVKHMINQVVRHYGRIDVLVNNAGVIHVGPISSMTIADFEQAMNVMFWGMVYTTMAALPHMRGRGDTRIVNITSVGAKVSVPHLVPYSCAKFAAAAFSEGMRAELLGSGVKVVTIAPGLLRTGSHLNALFKGKAEAESAWFSVSASMPGISMGAERAADQIISATRDGRAERILSPPANLLSAFHGLFPGTTSNVLGLVNKLLPGEGSEVRSGAQSRILKQPWMQPLLLLGTRAAIRLLQPV